MARRQPAGCCRCRRGWSATQEHWDAIYQTRATEDLGWYEPSPSTLDLVRRYSTPTDPVIDLGGGDSRMVDELVEAGYEDVTILDLSHAALERSRVRLGSAAGNVTWICADAADWEPASTWTLWHDRAVFHFLTTEDDRRRYVETTRQAIAPGGHLVIATFAPCGPEQCRSPGRTLRGGDDEPSSCIPASGAQRRIEYARPTRRWFSLSVMAGAGAVRCRAMRSR